MKIALFLLAALACTASAVPKDDSYEEDGCGDYKDEDPKEDEDIVAAPISPAPMILIDGISYVICSDNSIVGLSPPQSNMRYTQDISSCTCNCNCTLLLSPMTCSMNCPQTSVSYSYPESMVLTDAKGSRVLESNGPGQVAMGMSNLTYDFSIIQKLFGDPTFSGLAFNFDELRFTDSNNSTSYDATKVSQNYVKANMSKIDSAIQERLDKTMAGKDWNFLLALFGCLLGV